MTRWKLPTIFTWARPSALRRRGVLGINQRNASFILPGNARRLFPRVDDKLLTKRICEANNIPVPQTLGVIARQGDIRHFGELLGQRQHFVVKPAKGSEGRGIAVITARDRGLFVTANGRRLSSANMAYHLATVLAGMYTLSGQPDVAIIEQRIAAHPMFADVVPSGTPDVRLVMYRGFPVQAMMRLPTQSSGGRANLHQGAVGVGIDLAEGQTTEGVHRSRLVARHPDTGIRLRGLQIRQWPQLLRAAMALADSLALDYVGIDFVLDVDSGPLVLEANARPGLGIQLANQAGLLPRLRWIAQQDTRALDINTRLAMVLQKPKAHSTTTAAPPMAALQ